MSRHWRKVSKAIQKLATGLLEVKSEGMSPYETYYVLATDTELDATLRFGNDEHSRSGRQYTTIRQWAFARAGLVPWARVPAP
jgi:hypothetical protein